MKKFLLIALCLILSITPLCSCSKTAESEFARKAKENPTKTVYTALAEPLKGVASRSEILDIVTGACSKGTISVEFPVEVGKPLVSASIYNDMPASKSALILSGLPVNEDAFGLSTLDVSVYRDKSEFIVKSNGLLDSAPLGVDFKTLYDDLAGWSLWSDSGIAFEDLDQEVLQPVKGLCELLGDPAAISKINKAELVKFVKALDKYASVKDTKKNGVEAVAIDYNLKAENINEVVDVLLNWAKQYSEKLDADFAEFSADVTAAEYFKSQWMEGYEISVTILLNAETKDIMGVDVIYKYTFSPPGYGDLESGDLAPAVQALDRPVEYSFTLDFGTGLEETNKYKLVLSETQAVVFDEDKETETHTFSADILKTVTKDKTEYKITATSGDVTGEAVLYKLVSESGIEYKFARLSEKYPAEVRLFINTKDRTFEFSADEGADVGINYVSGSYEKGNDAFVIAVASAKEYAYDFGDIDASNADLTTVFDAEKDGGKIKITFAKGGTVEFPETYTKITSLTAEEFKEAFAFLFVFAEPQY